MRERFSVPLAIVALQSAIVLYLLLEIDVTGLAMANCMSALLVLSFFLACVRKQWCPLYMQQLREIVRFQA